MAALSRVQHYVATVKMRDGLYRVDSGSFCAGFVIEQGRVVAIAPCLRRIFYVVARQAQWISDAIKPPSESLCGVRSKE